jgi:WD40 repeat protein
MQSRFARLFVFGAGVAILTGASLSRPSVAEPTVSFHNEVRPILARRCAGCHQQTRDARAGKLSVMTYAGLKSGGVAGPGFVSGKPADSPLYKQISGKNPPMPKGGAPLASREVEAIRLWITQGARDDTPTAKDPISPERPPVYAAPPVVTAMAYSPDGELLAVSGYREILLHKSDGSGIVGRLVGRSQRIESLAFSPDGKTLAAVGGDSCKFGELQLWDITERKLKKSVELGFDVLYGVSYSPDGTMVAFGGAEKSVYVYKTVDASQVLKFDNHSDWVFGTTFSKDSKTLVSTSRDRAIKSIEIATGNFIDDINYQVYNGGYFAVARNPKTDEVAVAGEEGLIRYYSIYKKQARTMNREDYNLLRTFPNRQGPNYALAFNPDGTLIAEGGQTPDVRIFNVANGKLATTLKLPEGSVHALAWHPKGGQLAVTGFDGSVRLYAMPGGELATSFSAVPLRGKVALSR